MYSFPYSFPEPTPPRVGTHWRRKGEVMTWEVLEVRDEKDVVMQGPGGRKGTQTISLQDFRSGWERG